MDSLVVKRKTRHHRAENAGLFDLNAPNGLKRKTLKNTQRSASDSLSYATGRRRLRFIVVLFATDPPELDKMLVQVTGFSHSSKRNQLLETQKEAGLSTASFAEPSQFKSSDVNYEPGRSRMPLLPCFQAESGELYPSRKTDSGEPVERMPRGRNWLRMVSRPTDSDAGGISRVAQRDPIRDIERSGLRSGKSPLSTRNRSSASSRSDTCGGSGRSGDRMNRLPRQLHHSAGIGSLFKTLPAD